MENISEMYQGMLDAGEDWADKNAAAQLLEEIKKTIQSQVKITAIKDHASCGHGKLSDASAATVSLIDTQYISHIEKMVEARKEANKARVKYDSIKVYNELARSVESTRREEMKLI